MTNNIPAGAPVTMQPQAGQPVSFPAAGMPVAGTPYGMPMQPTMPAAGIPMQAGMPAAALMQPGQMPILTGTVQAPPAQAMPNIGDQSMNLYGSVAPSTIPSVTSNVSPNTLKIRRLTLVEAKRQVTQHSRSYMPMVDGHTLRVLENVKNTNPYLALTPNDVAKMQSEGATFFQTSAQTTGTVGIENGWDTRRFTFTLTVDVYFHNTFYCTEYLAGYTDHHGVSALNGSQALDPNMRFVITSVTRSMPRPSPVGSGQVLHTVGNASLVVAPNSTPGFTSPNQICMARPRDVYAEISSTAARRGAEALAGMNPAGAPATMSNNLPYLNMNTTVSNTPVLSNVNNNVASIYTSTLLSAAGKALESSSESSNPFQIARSAAQSREENYGSSYFANMISERMGGGFTSALTNTFTLGNLYAVDPVLSSSSDQRIAVMPSDIFAREITRTSSGQALMVPAGDSCDSFSGTGRDVADAITIMFAATAAFRTAGITYVSCRLTNYGGSDNFAITSLYGIDDGMLGNRATEACNNIIRDTVLAITRNSASYQIDLVVDINNDAYVKIVIGMGAQREFVMPCFALSSMSPVVGTRSTLDVVVDGMTTITDKLFDTGLVLGDMGSFNPSSVSY